jgi:ABC-type uncharacterized transport system substrate-binding protein
MLKHRASEEAAIPVVGFLSPTSPDGFTERLRGFRLGLNDTGYVEGDNVAIVYRWAENQIDRLPELAAELARRHVAVLAIVGNAATLAAKAITTIPIVFTVNEDPVRLGLVTSLARPGGSLTGVNFLAGELAAKRLEFLRELVPAASRVAVLVNPANATTAESTLRDVAPVARPWGCKCWSSRPVSAATSMQPSILWCASGPMRFSSIPILFFRTGVSNWSTWRPATRCPRYMRLGCHGRIPPAANIAWAGYPSAATNICAGF